MDEKISVIVPVYNVEQYLERCVASIINQTYKNLEIILVNDGSTDNSGQLCDELAKKDDRIRVIHKKNGGVSETRNLGSRESNGKYITFIDSDDVVSVNMIEELYTNLLGNGADISIGNVIHNYNINNVVFDDSNNDILSWNNEEALKEFLKAKITSFYPVAKLFKKNIILDLEFNVDFKLAEDAMFITEILLEKDVKVVYSFKDVYAYCHRGESATTSINSNTVFDTIKVYDIILPKIEKKYPDLKRYVELRKNWANFEVFDKLILSRDPLFDKERKYLKNKIISSRSEILKENLFTLNRKISLLALSLSEYVYKKLLLVRKKH